MEVVVQLLLEAGATLGAMNLEHQTPFDLAEAVTRERVVYRLRAKRVEILTVFEGHRLLREEEVEGDD